MDTHVTAMTFVLGEEAAEAVNQQLNDTAAYLRCQKTEQNHRDAAAVARMFDAQFRATPNSFDLTICHSPNSTVRTAWQGEGTHGGLLFIIENGMLRSVNLLFPGISETAEKRLMDRAQSILGQVEPYSRCFDLVRQAERPLIATFCANGGQLTRGVELALFTFASVFFICPQAKPKGTNTIALLSRS
jgi:hypothetical protein